MSFAPSYRLNNANVRFSTKMCLLGNYMHEGKEKKGGGESYYITVASRCCLDRCGEEKTGSDA